MSILLLINQIVNAEIRCVKRKLSLPISNPRKSSSLPCLNTNRTCKVAYLKKNIILFFYPFGGKPLMSIPSKDEKVEGLIHANSQY